MTETTTKTNQEPTELPGGEPIEEHTATINPATCEVRLAIECSAMGCERKAGLVWRTNVGDNGLPTAIPYCNDHLVEASTTPKGDDDGNLPSPRRPA